VPGSCVLGSSPHPLIEYPLYSPRSLERSKPHLLLATARHKVALVRFVFVPASTAIELIPAPSTARVDSVNVFVARATVDYVVVGSSRDEVSSAKAAYLVLAFTTGQLVTSVGAGEQATFGASGYVIRDI
jgi:hypothetical protein